MFAGWWFGTFSIFHILGMIIPTDFHIFQRGRLNHQPVCFTCPNLLALFRPSPAGRVLADLINLNSFSIWASQTAWIHREAWNHWFL